ncbi:phage tail terminator-like protein [Pseudomonas sp.]|uniref:phage tail terminator-like protein n=1 Tax=Pseudomonas sp. TaxID=306 RepID=UPI0028A671A6|nr:phage tail terminator-like protein [Pseudomonas sp.]
MTVPFETVRKTLTARMAAFTGIDQARVEYPNSPQPDGTFKPPANGVWCAFEIQYATPFLCGLADTPTYRRPGQVVIQCFVRRGEGLGTINRLADGLSDHFQSWQAGHIECMEVGQQLVGYYEDYYQTNVTVRFRAG